MLSQGTMQDAKEVELRQYEAQRKTLNIAIDAINKGSQLYKEEKLEQAKKCFDLVINLKNKIPSNSIISNAYVKRAIIHHEQKNATQAIDDCTNSIIHTPENNQLHTILKTCIAASHSNSPEDYQTFANRIETSIANRFLSERRNSLLEQNPDIAPDNLDKALLELYVAYRVTLSNTPDYTVMLSALRNAEKLVKFDLASHALMITALYETAQTDECLDVTSRLIEKYQTIKQFETSRFVARAYFYTGLIYMKHNVPKSAVSLFARGASTDILCDAFLYTPTIYDEIVRSIAYCSTQTMPSEINADNTISPDEYLVKIKEQAALKNFAAAQSLLDQAILSHTHVPEFYRQRVLIAKQSSDSTQLNYDSNIENLCFAIWFCRLEPKYSKALNDYKLLYHSVLVEGIKFTTALNTLTELINDLRSEETKLAAKNSALRTTSQIADNFMLQDKNNTRASLIRTYATIVNAKILPVEQDESYTQFRFVFLKKINTQSQRALAIKFLFASDAKQCESLYKEGKLDEAISGLSYALDLEFNLVNDYSHPDNIEMISSAYARRAKYLFLKGKLQEAKEDLEQAYLLSHKTKAISETIALMKLCGALPDAFLADTHSLWQQSCKHNIENLLAAANPNNSTESISMLAQELSTLSEAYLLSDYKLVSKLLIKASEKCMLHPDMCVMLAVSHYNLSNYEATIQATHRTIKMANDDTAPANTTSKTFARAYFYRGLSYFAQGKVTEAKADFYSALLIDNHGLALNTAEATMIASCIRDLTVKDNTNHFIEYTEQEVTDKINKAIQCRNTRPAGSIALLNQVITHYPLVSKAYHERALTKFEKDNSTDKYDAIFDTSFAIWLYQYGFTEGNLYHYHESRQRMYFKTGDLDASFQDYLEALKHTDTEDKKNRYRDTFHQQLCNEGDRLRKNKGLTDANPYYQCALNVKYSESLEKSIASWQEGEEKQSSQQAQLVTAQKIKHEKQLQKNIDRKQKRIEQKEAEKELKQAEEQRKLTEAENEFKRKEQQAQQQQVKTIKNAAADKPKKPETILPKPTGKLHQAAIEIIQKIQQVCEAKQTFVVGGAVRNFLNGIDEITSDIDIVTEATPEQLTLKFQQLLVQDPHVKNLFHVKTTDNIKIDIYCSEYLANPTQGLVNDALSRDFTIGALYADIHSNVLDPTGLGLRDLQNRIINVIPPTTPLPEGKTAADVSFEKDPFRMLRAIYLAAKYKLELSQEVQDAIKKHAHRLKDSAYSGKINALLSKIISIGNLKKVKTAFNLLISEGIFQEIFPAIAEQLKDSNDANLKKSLYQSIKYAARNKSLKTAYDHFISVYDPEGTKELYKNNLMKQCFEKNKHYPNAHRNRLFSNNTSLQLPSTSTEENYKIPFRPDGQ